jgi:hypothetical protein
MGTISFTLFIFEEAQQTIMFSTWQSIDCAQWNTVATSCQLMHDLNETMNRFNNWVGWINPLSFISYNAYYKASATYISALRTKVFLHVPEELEGCWICLTVMQRSFKQLNDGNYVVYFGQRCKIILPNLPKSHSFLVKGMVHLDPKDGMVTIRK